MEKEILFDGHEKGTLLHIIKSQDHLGDSRVQYNKGVYLNLTFAIC